MAKMTDDKLGARRIRPSLIALAVSQALVCVPAESLQAAIINVDPEGTTNPCTLHDAIMTANDDSPPSGSSCEHDDNFDIINLPPNTTINLDSKLPLITSGVTINGNGSTIQPGSSAGGFTLLEAVNSDYRTNLEYLELKDLTLSAGGVHGLHSRYMILDVYNCIITGNSQDGVRITDTKYNSAGFSIRQSTISNNSIIGVNITQHGETFPDYNSLSIIESEISGNGFGGVQVFNAGLVIRSSTISGNAVPNGRGISVSGEYRYSGSPVNTRVSLQIISSTVAGHSATGSGAGVFVYYGAASISKSTISGNSSTGNGGGIMLDDIGNYTSTSTIINSSVRNNIGQFGGGINTSNTDLVIIDSKLTNNHAAVDGGALIFQAAGETATISNTTIASNSAAYYGGGLEVTTSAELVLNGSTVSDNTANESGGGVSLFSSASAQVVNSTVSGNVAKDRGGGFYAGAATTLTVYNGTVFENSVVTGGITPLDSGGGIWANASALMHLSNTVIASSKPRDCGGLKPGAAILNWSEDISCNGVARGDPKLGSLEFNGGPTKTHAPLPGSGLEGEGDLLSCELSPVNNVDQRGETRNSPCFIGAVDDVIDPTVFFTIPLPNGKAVVISL